METCDFESCSAEQVGLERERGAKLRITSKGGVGDISCEEFIHSKASTTDEVESSSRRSTTDDFGEDSDYGDDSVSDTDSNDENEKSKSSTLRERRKYMDPKQHCTKTNAQSDTETKNLLDDMGEEIDDDFSNLHEMNCHGKQNGALELDEKLFELSDEQLNYYTNCFLFLMQKSQGSVSMQGALQGNDRIILDFFRKSSLDDLTLSKIWSLSDVNEDGFLNLAEFVLAMHLIVLHKKGSVPIPSRLPPSVRPSETPTRVLVHAHDDFAGSLSNRSLSNSSTKITAECVSSNSANSQMPSDRTPKIQNAQKHSFGQQQTVANGKQHSLSDDHLNSQRPTTIAKFSDVPPLLVDGHPTALNAAASSQVLPQFARLFVATARGPPPLPPFRNYNSGNTTGSGPKGHGRSVSLDLKTFSALSSNFDLQQKSTKDEVDGSSSGNKNQLTENLAQLANDKSSQMFCSTSTVGTQTDCIVDCCEKSLSICGKLEMENKISANERCKILQRINEQLEEERIKLKQIRLQIQLRIDEAERKLSELNLNSVNKRVNKPTIL